MSDQVEQPAAYPTSVGGKDSPGLLRALDYIEEHFSNAKIDLGKLAEVAALPTNTLTRQFKNKTGFPPMKSLWRRRCQAAKTLIILDPSKPLGDVAHQCGFSSQAHFSRRMKDYMDGVSPIHFRKSQQKAKP